MQIDKPQDSLTASTIPPKHSQMTSTEDQSLLNDRMVRGGDVGRPIPTFDGDEYLGNASGLRGSSGSSGAFRF